MLPDKIIIEKSVMLVDINGKPINLTAPQPTNGNVVTTLAGNTFTAPNKQSFCLSNETDTDITLMVTFADGSVPVSKRIRVGDNPYVLKSFVMSDPAVSLFYLQ